MKKNTKTAYLLVAIIAVAGITSSAFVIDRDTSMDSQTASEVVVIQQIKGSMDNYSLAELVTKSEYAIIGTVDKITPVIVESRNSHENTTYITVFSDIQVRVEQDLSDRYNGNEISVRIHGGQLGDAKTVADLSPEFGLNERVLFFVAAKEPHTIWGDNYYVAGLHLGKYKLDDGYAIREKVDSKQTESDLIAIIQALKEN